MKKIKFEGKLCLNKETVTKLNKEQMETVQGGILWTLFCKPRKSYDDTCGMTVGVSCACEPNNTRYCPVPM